MEISLPRLRRAIRHSPPIGLWMGIIATLGTIGGTTLAVWWEVKDDAEYSVEVILVPAAAGLAGAVFAFALVSGTHVVYRYVTQKAPSGSARDLRDLGKARDRVLHALVNANPGGVHNLHQIHFDNETADFIHAIADLFADAGWEMDVNQEMRLTNERTVDVQIQMPTGGNSGLEAFASLLRKLGYKVSVQPSEYDGRDSGGNLTAWIWVGEATH